MARRRHDRGFSPLGSLAPERLGLPRRQGRELALDHAWRTVAGAPIWRRTCRITLRRGVLELTIDDKGWVRTLEEVAPELVARLALCHPELGVRRFRVRFEGDDGPAPPAVALPAIEPPRSEVGPVGATAGPKRPSREPGAEKPPSPVDLTRVMERYLERCAERRAQKP